MYHLRKISYALRSKSSNDTPEEYTVEFQVQYWTYANDNNAGNAVSLTGE